jgi:hypothetical protein
MIQGLLKILLFIILIPCLSISQSVTHQGDKICFDVVTASELFNDLNYRDSLIKQKSDSICMVLEQNNVLESNNEKCKDKLTNKNTGLWITGGFNFVLGLMTYIFASLNN